MVVLNVAGCVCISVSVVGGIEFICVVIQMNIWIYRKKLIEKLWESFSNAENVGEA